MKKKTILMIICGSVIAACSSDNAPTPSKLTHDVQAIEPLTVISVIAQEDLPPSKGAQNLIKFSLFKTVDNTYDGTGDKILIPRDAIISGIYANDGVNCKISWKGVYTDMDKYNAHQGAVVLDQITDDTPCSPELGITKDSRVTLHFAQKISQ